MRTFISTLALAAMIAGPVAAQAAVSQRPAAAAQGSIAAATGLEPAFQDRGERGRRGGDGFRGRTVGGGGPVDRRANIEAARGARTDYRADREQRPGRQVVDRVSRPDAQPGGRYYDRNRDGNLDRRFDRNRDGNIDRRLDTNRDGQIDRRFDRNDDNRIDRRVDRDGDRRVDRLERRGYYGRNDRAYDPSRDGRRYDNRYRYDRNRYDYNRGYRQGYADWNRDWRRDRRYDWYSYRNQYRNFYRLPRYIAPYGVYGYRRFGIGVVLGSSLFASSYWINDPWSYRLPAASGPYRWIRYYDDVLLVNIYTGEVVDVIHDFFW